MYSLVIMFSDAYHCGLLYDEVLSASQLTEGYACCDLWNDFPARETQRSALFGHLARAPSSFDDARALRTIAHAL